VRRAVSCGTYPSEWNFYNSRGGSKGGQLFGMRGVPRGGPETARPADESGGAWHGVPIYQITQDPAEAAQSSSATSLFGSMNLSMKALLDLLPKDVKPAPARPAREPAAEVQGEIENRHAAAASAFIDRTSSRYR
jgi:hypothetical protein